MGRTTAFRLGALLLLCSFCSAYADELRIRHAERIELRADATRTSFNAFGRRFDVELEPNDRLLRRLSAAQKARLGDFALYRGQIAGRDGTWVRLTRFGGELHGAIWDGSELLIVQPARVVRGSLVAQTAASDGDHLIYRLADTESSLDTGVCGVGNRQMLGGAREYAALVQELRERFATVAIPAEQIEIEFIADSQFSARAPINPQFEMLTRVNIVDGIYGDQVGVTIVPTFRLFTSANDPFLGEDAESLLGQLGEYRENTPDVRARGLAHLLTGRNLRAGGNPNVLGIAFIASLCETFGGVGVSEAADGLFVAALVMAHEIGHNFGAPHDAEAGSVCESAPPGLLMDAFFNSSDRFSQCSLDQMRPQIEAAACVIPAQYADVTVTIPEPIRALIGQPFDYVIEAAAQGNQTANGVSVEISNIGSLTLHSAIAEGGTCSQGPGPLTCQLGAMPASTTRRITLRLTIPFGPGTFETFATARSGNDRIPANDRVTVPIFVGSAADVSVTVTPTSISSPTRQVHTFTATVTSHGPLAASDVRVAWSGAFKMRPETASSPGATCATDVFFASCTIATIPSGESRQVVFTARGTSAGAFSAEITASADNDEIPSNDATRTAVTLTAVSDAALGAGWATTAVVGEPFSLQVPLTSLGQEAVEDVELRLSPAGPNLVMESVTITGGTCAPVGFVFGCTLATLPPGTTRTLDARLRATDVMNRVVQVWIFAATNDEDPGNNSSNTLVRARHLADVGVSAAGHTFVELQPFVVRIPVRSSGHNAVTDVATTITLPTAITLLAADLQGGTCTTTGSAASCTLASLAPDMTAFLDLTVQGNSVGSFLADVTVGAINDTNASNASAQVRLEVAPFFDAALDAPGSVTALLNETVDLPLTVTTLNQVMSQVSVRAEQITVGVIESVTTTAGTCSVTNLAFVARVECAIGTLPARSSATVTLRLRTSNPTAFTMSAQMVASQDVTFANNSRQVVVTIDRLPDARFDPGPLEITAQVNTAFTVPGFVSVMGLPGITNLVATYPLPSSMTASAAAAEGGNCTISATAVTCVFAQPPGGGLVRTINMTMRGTVAGRFPTTATLTATNDSDTTNNSLAVTYVINPPPAPPINNGGGGGGGGGALGSQLLLALWLASLLAGSRRLRIRQPASVC
jgi:hypothetical protein